MTTRTHLHARAIAALRLHVELSAADLARELGVSHVNTCGVLRDLVRAGTVDWQRGTLARLRAAVPKSSDADDAILNAPRGYSVRDSLGNEVAWFAAKNDARTMWRRVTCAQRVVDVAAGVTVVTADMEDA